MTKGRQQGTVLGQANPTPEPLIDRDVNQFSAAMKDNLRAKSQYGYWQGIDPQFYLDRLLDELAELEEAWAQDPAECVDVTNMAMMLFTNLQRKFSP